MKIYDVTLPLKKGMTCFPGDPEFEMSPYFSREKGDPFNLCELRLCTHTGTHIDPPAHYIDGGITVDKIPLDNLIGSCLIMDLRGIKEINRKILAKKGLLAHERILLKTDNGPLLSRNQFFDNYVYLTEDGAEFLVQNSVKLVGIDYMSIEKYMNPGAPVHNILMDAGIVIVEGLNLLNVPPGEYEIICLPLLIEGADGAPARVVLTQQID